MFSVYAGNARSSCLVVGAVARCSTHVGLRHCKVGHRNCWDFAIVGSITASLLSRRTIVRVCIVFCPGKCRPGTFRADHSVDSQRGVGGCVERNRSVWAMQCWERRRLLSDGSCAGCSDFGRHWNRVLLRTGQHAPSPADVLVISAYVFCAEKLVCSEPNAAMILDF